MISAPAARPWTAASPHSGGVLDSEGDAKRLADIEKDLAKPDAWGNPEALTPVLQEKSRIEGNLARYKELKDCRDDMSALLELAGESEGEELQELLESLDEQLGLLEKLLDDTEMVTLLGDEEDSKNAILEIHPGAGGTEAQDWAEMLLRLYTRWAARRGFKCEEMDYLPGEEAGVKRVTLRLIGPYAFGQLRSERGIHRLIRISPFDNSGRRHTSFASVDVEMKNGVAKQVQRKMLPGYVLLNMVMNDDTWYVVRNTRGVTGFVGPGSKPVPLPKEQMQNLGIHQEEIQVGYDVGDTVVVIGGAWKDTTGVVASINKQKQTVTINVELFGRETPVEISFSEIRKL